MHDSKLTCGRPNPEATHRLVIDDPLSPEQAESDTQRRRANDRVRQLITRVDNKAHDRIVLVMQRFHVEDATAICRDLGFEHLCLPALAPRRTTVVFPRSGRMVVRAVDEPLCPAREDTDQLRKMRETIGSYAFAGQYQQDPIPRTGGLFDPAWWRWVDDPPPFTEVYQSWDLSLKGHDGADYVVGLVAARVGALIYLLDRYKAKVGFADTVRAIEAMVQRYPQTRAVLVEDAAREADARQRTAHFYHRRAA